MKYEGLMRLFKEWLTVNILVTILEAKDRILNEKCSNDLIQMQRFEP